MTYLKNRKVLTHRIEFLILNLQNQNFNPKSN